MVSERKCALSSSNYLKLKEIYENRETEARKWAGQGKRIALTMGSDVPEELLVAAGYVPIAVHSDYGRPTDTGLYLEESCDHDAWTRGVMQKLVDGTYKAYAERVVLSYSTLRMYNLFNVLREIHRQIPDTPVPYVYYMDVDFSKTLFGQKHNMKVFSDLKQAIEGWTGNELTESRILEAVDTYNAFRDTLRAFDALRRGETPRVTGTEALTVIGASLFMDKAEHTALVRALTEEAAGWPEVAGPRVFVTGSDQDTPELYDIIESLGGNVVMEDHNFGARYYEKNVEYLRDPVRGIADRYIFRMPTGKVSVKERVETLKECVLAAKADAVVMYLKVNDIGASWDYPSLKKMLDELNIPIVRFYDQETPMANRAEVESGIGAMLKEIKGGKANV